jgi:hypothetical protein
MECNGTAKELGIFLVWAAVYVNRILQKFYNTPVLTVIHASFYTSR